ncbi:bifunctional aldolase/short-chain dehydrogenase [soil metagenome]
MHSRWNDAEAADFIARYAAQGVPEPLALRVYTSRLLGSDPTLVQNGGGNTSVKLTLPDLDGAPVPCICVKGSGWDLGDIEPQGLPAMRLEPLLKLRPIERMSDEQMVDAQRGALLTQSSPTPSVETLLHAWAPYTFVDHSHANAVLALTDQPNAGAELCAEVFGPKIALVPYVMPGFGLARAAAAVIEASPDAEGMVLLQHGFFTWGDTAKESYERHVRYVTLAEERIAKAPRRAVAPRSAPAPRVAQLAPLLRGLVSRAAGRSMVLDHRDGDVALSWAADPERARRVLAGTVTPDHVIRTKGSPLVLSQAELASGADAAFEAYAARYRTYFDANDRRVGGGLTALDPAPRVILVEGLGLFGVGASKKDAAVAADIAETNLTVIADAEAVGAFEPLSDAHLFDVEYWSLEQAKLGKAAPKRLAGKVVAVTGGASGIGAATVAAFRAEGAEVAVLDLASTGAAFPCDATDAASVTTACARIVETYGGLDILVSNAGAAWQGRIGTVDEATLRTSFELNFWGHQRCAQAAVAIFKAQDTGGVLLFNASKQALNPGPDFGPYGLPKAALLALMRQYAVDQGADGVRANAVTADRIRSGLLTDDMVKTRSTARGLSEADYMGGNLLGEEVRATDVAQAFVSLALAERTTGAVLTVDGGNIAAAVR